MVTAPAPVVLPNELPQTEEAKTAPRVITPTPEELKASAFDTANIEVALEALHQDGFVVLKSVVDVAHVDAINDYMSKEADELVRTKAKAFNQGVNCMLMNPHVSLQY
jgi:hypothetical protein